MRVNKEQEVCREEEEVGEVQEGGGCFLIRSFIRSVIFSAV